MNSSDEDVPAKEKVCATNHGVTYALSSDYITTNHSARFACMSSVCANVNRTSDSDGPQPPVTAPSKSQPSRYVITIVNSNFCVFAAASETCRVNFAVPLAVVVGLPLICPLVASRFSPSGSLPLTKVHLYGFVPPDAARVSLHCWSTLPSGSTAGVTMASGSGGGEVRD